MFFQKNAKEKNNNIILILFPARPWSPTWRIATTAAAPAKVSAAEPLNAPLAGNIFKVLVSPGQKVNQGDVIIILEAMKMTSAQIATLASSPDTIGSYRLLAPIDGRVQQDLAMLGQVFSSGTALMQLTDESHLWVEAQVTPAQSESISVGSEALVRVGQKHKS